MKLPGLLSRSQKGQALVEFALVVPLLLVMVFGIIEFGMLWKSQQVLTDAAREGARAAVVADGATEEEVRQVVRDALARGGVSCTDCFEIYAVDDPDNTNFKSLSTGEAVRVDIEHTYDFIVFDRLVEWTVGNVTLNTSSVMRKE